MRVYNSDCGRNEKERSEKASERDPIGKKIWRLLKGGIYEKAVES